MVYCLYKNPIIIIDPLYDRIEDDFFESKKFRITLDDYLK